MTLTRTACVDVSEASDGFRGFADGSFGLLVIGCVCRCDAGLGGARTTSLDAMNALSLTRVLFLAIQGRQISPCVRELQRR